MLELYFVRHGQTQYSLQNRFCGTTDAELTEVGKEMAEAVAAGYGGLDWTAIYSSPSQRARNTAAPLAARAKREVIIEDGLREISYGQWEGLSHEDARANYPDEYAYWSHDTASRATPQGETAFAVAARAASTLEQIRSRHEDGRVLIVSHKATIRILVCSLLGLDVRLFRDRISQPVAAVTRFDIKKKSGPLLVMHGSTEHLPLHLRNEEGT